MFPVLARRGGAPQFLRQRQPLRSLWCQGGELNELEDTNLTHPAIVATNILPSASGFEGTFSDSALEAILNAPQNVATEVPTIQPDPVISPKNGWPFFRRTTRLPSDTQSTTPVMPMMLPRYPRTGEETQKIRFRVHTHVL